MRLTNRTILTAAAGLALAAVPAATAVAAPKALKLPAGFSPEATIVKTLPRARLSDAVDVARLGGHLWVLNIHDPRAASAKTVDEIVDLGTV